MAQHAVSAFVLLWLAAWSTDIGENSKTVFSFVVLR